MTVASNLSVERTAYGVRSPLRYTALKIVWLASLVLWTEFAHAGDFPCGIASMRRAENEVALQFDKSYSWHFTHSNGDAGFIGSGAIHVLERRGEGVKQPIAEAEIRVGLNERLVLSNHHL